VSNAGRPFKWDKKDAKGKSGGEPTGQGAEKTEPRLKLLLWQDTNGTNHFDLWYQVLQPRLMQAAYSTPPEALPIYYPTLADNRIDTVSIKKIGALQPEGRQGLWSITIDFIEVSKAKPGGGTPSGVSGGTGTGSKEQQYKDAADAEAEAYQRALDEQAQEEAERQQAEWEEQQEDSFGGTWIEDEEPDDDGEYQDLEWF
jgi:hypothetical protein